MDPRIPQLLCPWCQRRVGSELGLGDDQASKKGCLGKGEKKKLEEISFLLNCY
jgi:hypothetical protein